MNWKRRMGICCVLAVMALTLAVYGAASGGIDRTKNIEQAGITERENEDSAYILTESNGYVAICSAASEGTPAVITDIEARTLRDSDRLMLERGIRVASREELMMLLEDLGS
jgi:hypothetical protein